MFFCSCTDSSFSCLLYNIHVLQVSITENEIKWNKCLHTGPISYFHSEHYFLPCCICLVLTREWISHELAGIVFHEKFNFKHRPWIVFALAFIKECLQWGRNSSLMLNPTSTMRLVWRAWTSGEELIVSLESIAITCSHQQQSAYQVNDSFSSKIWACDFKHTHTQSYCLRLQSRILLNQ